MASEVPPDDWQLVVDPGVLYLWVIFDHPHDFPDHFVVRRHGVTGGGQTMVYPEIWLRESVDACRTVIERNAPGLICLTRDATDDPKIVETWL